MNVLENPSPDFERQFVLAINARRKLKGNKPKFVITSNQVLSSNEEKETNQVILTIKSIQTLLLSCTDKCPRAYSASWCKILRVQKLQQIVVIVLNGITDENYNRLNDTELVQEWQQLFTSDNVCHTFRFHTQKNIPFIEQFSKIAAKTKSTNQSQDRSTLKSKAEQLSNKKRTLEETDENSSQILKKSNTDQYSRVNLVLNLKQLITGNYPCPIYNQFKNFKQIKSSYKPITSSSRIFALDVETYSDMINNRQVPYWISIVDEELNCIYQTLIKPNESQHMDTYQPRREQVIETVPNISEKSLEEVHEDFRILFDDDLILAGHSIENDLKYLQIYYPYIIDTSIIFNVTGTRLEKTSLQKLYAIFFGRLIQKTRLEHDPTEDARATMELVQLKLGKNIEFGDWFLGGVDQLKVLGNYDSLQLDENIQECQTFLAQTKFGLQEDFFKRIKHQNRALVIDQALNNTKISLPTMKVNSNRQVFKTSIEKLSTHEFLWLQFYVSLNDDQSFAKITKYIKKIYKSLREDSILIGIFSDQDDFGRCFVRIKDDEKLSPLIINGKEYPYDLKLVKTT
ncbi:unnamed protein product [Rotaria magnacalcarata]|uniref:Exonuclease domain-containing protein n=1 Tax=Rotaria magnacalcarata TaxID=392030 RepID=A0A819B4T9_9BILA|nr:unnamed protein product [Rotaria magnacalcarata]CAF2120382.1 unnamed protein product [Rotaria magnacalcarata]CAF3757389.1 unnamed protein product [Rotaria magnacalcarata]CAF3788232.1 unnamed protein product [Rotaria magnacalcarata]